LVKDGNIEKGCSMRESERQREKEKDRERQRETERDRERQREREREEFGLYSRLLFMTSACS
jgi:hypothetical protein